LLSIKFVSDFRELGELIEYSRSKLKVAKNCTKFAIFLHFLLFEIFGVWAPESDHAHLTARHVTNFHGLNPFTLKVISADSLNFKQIFDPLKNNR